ncbi:MAG: hypothetical protein JKX97_06290 [Candidatus Lindowbacteria bacterium]|nr:hypothetical protein [Candidatus Lindowbacteria bacterium]
MISGCAKSKGSAQPAVLDSATTDNKRVTVIARVDDRILTQKDIYAIDPTGTLTADDLAGVVENWIEGELYLKLAKKRGISSDSIVNWQIEQARAEILLGALGDKLIVEKGSDTAAKAYLRKQVAELRENARIESNPWKIE